MRVVLPRQKRNFTCGIAALAAAAQLLGLNFPKGTILSSVGARPIIGTDNEPLAEWTKGFMPVKSHGSNTYDGGLAIANIQNQDSGIGHFVTFLGERDGKIRYWCPLLGDVFEYRREDIVWKNSTGDILNWSINFETDKDFYDMSFTPERHVFFIGDPLNELKHDVDTSLTIKAAYEARGQSVSWHTPEEVFTKHKQLYLDGVPVLENDLVWFRLNPSNSIQYYELLRNLTHVDAKIVNEPQAILNFNDKLSVKFLQNNYTYTVASMGNVKKAYDHLLKDGFTKFIVKPPSLYGGQSIALVDNLENMEKAFLENVDPSGYVIIQGAFDTEKPARSTRVILTPYRIIGMFDKVAGDGSFVTNIAAGGHEEKTEKLSDEQIKVCDQIRVFMKENNIFMLSPDFIGDTLLELNVTCPGGIVQTNILNKSHIEYELIDDCNKYIEEHLNKKAA